MHFDKVFSTLGNRDYLKMHLEVKSFIGVNDLSFKESDEVW